MALQGKLLGFLVSVLQAILFAALISTTTVLILLFWMILLLMRMHLALSKGKKFPIWFWVPFSTLSLQPQSRLTRRLLFSKRRFTMMMFRPEHKEAQTGTQLLLAVGPDRPRTSPMISSNPSGK